MGRYVRRKSVLGLGLVAQVGMEKEVRGFSTIPIPSHLRYRDYFEVDLTNGEMRVRLDEPTLDFLKRIVRYFTKSYATRYCRDMDMECLKEIEPLVSESVAGSILQILRTWIQTFGYYLQA